MLFTHIVQHILEQRDIPYTLVDMGPSEFDSDPDNHPPQLPLQQLVSVSFVKDNHGTMMAMYPEGYQLDLGLLKALTHRPDLRFLSTSELEDILQGLRQAEVSPTQVADIQVIIDEPISNLDEAYFHTNVPGRYIQTNIWDIQVLVENALIGGEFSYSQEDKGPHSNRSRSHVSLRDKLTKLDKLPTMPGIASELMLLQNNPDSTVDDMVRIIAHDPVLTAQILRYANSSLFGFSGQITNLHDAIFRVLGYETVLYMAFGAALGRSFKLPNTGRLGLDKFWQQATYRAALAQQLAQHMPRHFRPPPSMAYLTGLLHNFGLILMGSMFPEEYSWLNKMVSNRPEQSIYDTEQNLFGYTHNELSQYVFEQWNMPAEIITVAGNHHRELYSGKHATYVWIVQLAGQALKAHGFSETTDEHVSPELCKQLELDEATVLQTLEQVVNESDALQAMAKTLCA